MRTFIFLISLLTYTFCLGQSTTYKSFEGGVNIGGVSSKDMGGLSTGLEARYNLSDQLSFGVQLGSIVLFDIDEAKQSEGDVEEGINLASLSITGDYYFRNAKSRFFAGLELGYYRVRSIQIENEEITSLGNQVGFTPRIGARFGWFRPVIKYHIVPKFDASNFSAWDLTLSVTFGGKKK